MFLTNWSVHISNSKPVQIWFNKSLICFVILFDNYFLINNIYFIDFSTKFHNLKAKINEKQFEWKFSTLIDLQVWPKCLVFPHQSFLIYQWNENKVCRVFPIRSISIIRQNRREKVFFPPLMKLFRNQGLKKKKKKI